MVYLDSTFHTVPDGVMDEPGVDEQPVTPLGLQAREIIDSILDDVSPGLAEVKWRLRKCLAAHPGSPEQALLAHLMETSELVNHGTR
ncbi:hypothetical protein [Pseudarthrobacter sp. DSP2-3-2b1]|uniref:hypothetical protein n=1 Tax=Pseudarthrobacter sp. DSP2-3-2b1 TaxID=2804661 RepID=UPI003CF26092